MMHCAKCSIVSITSLLLVAMAADCPNALAGNVEFSADAVQSMAGQPSKSGKLHVGKLGSRFEFVENGQPIIHITRTDGIVRVLFPSTRSYMEFKAPPGAVPASMTPEAPCAPAPGVECRLDGDEQTTLGKLQKWTINAQGAPGPMHVWWDAARRLPLRQEMPDGSVMQAAPQAAQQFDGRAVETWDITLASKDGKQLKGLVLYAPDLGLTVKEQQPAGATRELRNVKMVALDPNLLEVPQGYAKMEPPAPPAQPSQQPRR